MLLYKIPKQSEQFRYWVHLAISSISTQFQGIYNDNLPVDSLQIWRTFKSLFSSGLEVECNTYQLTYYLKHEIMFCYLVSPVKSLFVSIGLYKV